MFEQTRFLHLARLSNLRFLNAFNVLDSVLGVRLERWPSDLSQQGHVVALNFVADIVKRSKPRKHKKFVRNFVGDALLGAGRGLFLAGPIAVSANRLKSTSDSLRFIKFFPFFLSTSWIGTSLRGVREQS
jgi:hypothetical protein